MVSRGSVVVFSNVGRRCMLILLLVRWRLRVCSR